jgi:hypothetical protein
VAASTTSFSGDPEETLAEHEWAAGACGIR